MLVKPDYPYNGYRILSIDPGTDTLGVSVIEVDLVTRIPAVIEVLTFKSGKNVRLYPELEDNFGTRYTKLEIHRQCLVKLIYSYRPDIVICESPYLGRFPNAFEALIQCLGMIQSAVSEYDPWLVLETIDPSTVKKIVGVKGKGSLKDVVKECVLNLRGLENRSGKDLTLCDEHSIDAIAVGCYKLHTLGIEFMTQNLLKGQTHGI